MGDPTASDMERSREIAGDLRATVPDDEDATQGSAEAAGKAHMIKAKLEVYLVVNGNVIGESDDPVLWIEVLGRMREQEREASLAETGEQREGLGEG